MLLNHAGVLARKVHECEQGVSASRWGESKGVPKGVICPEVVVHVRVWGALFYEVLSVV